MMGFIISSHAFASSNVPTAQSILAQRFECFGREEGHPDIKP